jgi:hypothetical protein
MVCEKCAADWATCGEPSGRVVRLGVTARLRDIDPTGRLGFVTHWRKAPRLFDLRQLRWIRGTDIFRRAYLWNRQYPPRLTGDGRLIYGAWTASSRYQSEDMSLFEGMRVANLRSGEHHVVSCDRPEHGTAVSATGDSFYFVTDTQRVVLIVPGASAAIVFDPLPRKVIQAVHLDADRNLLAASSWSELVLHRIADGNLERLSHLETETNGDVRWIAIGGPWLAAAIMSLSGTARIEVRRLERDASIGDVVHQHQVPNLRAASLSRDGSYLAIASPAGVLVHALATDTVTVFEEHTARINLLRFAGDDHVLISADEDNRVILRPRTATGYARPLIPIEVPREGVDLPPLDDRPSAVA